MPSTNLPFSSDGGFTTSSNIASGNINVTGAVSATGNITSPFFIGNVVGNISGNLTAPGANTDVLFNNNGVVGASSGLTFNTTGNVLSVTGNVVGGNLLTCGAVSVGGIVTIASTAGNVLSTTGNITASNFFGNVIGNISGNLTAPGANTDVLFNNNGVVGASSGLTFNTTSNVLSSGGNIITCGSFSASGSLSVNNISASGTANIARLRTYANSIALGANAGGTNQGINSIAIGCSAGNSSQAGLAVAIGVCAGKTNQHQRTVAIGGGAGGTCQTDYAIAIGDLAGTNNQGLTSVAIGRSAGQSSQGSCATAIGPSSGACHQGTKAVAMGLGSGICHQGNGSIAIGALAGAYTQGTGAIALGCQAGKYLQCNNAIAIGTGTGNGITAVATNSAATFINGSNVVLLVGTTTGTFKVGMPISASGTNFAYNATITQVNPANLVVSKSSTTNRTIAVSGGGGGQSSNSIAIGTNAGHLALTANSIAIGAGAGNSGTANNVIILNATGANLTGSTACALYVSPVRNDAVTAIGNVLVYNTSTNEIAFSNTLSVAGNITAPFFIGNVVGNISGNLTAPGANTDILFNNNGSAGASGNLTFDSAINALSVAGTINATGNIQGAAFKVSGTTSGVHKCNAFGTAFVEDVSQAGSPGFYLTGGACGLFVFGGTQPVHIETGCHSWTFGTDGTLSAPGTISTSGNVFAGFLHGDGSNISNIAGSYGNANVTALLSSGTVSNNIITTGNVTAGNVLSGTVSVSGKVTIASTAGNVLSTTGNIAATNFFGNIVGNLTAPGANTNILFNNNGIVGATSGLTFNTTGNVLSVNGNIKAPGTISTSGNVFGAFLHGDGSNISNISGLVGSTTGPGACNNTVLGVGAGGSHCSVVLGHNAATFNGGGTGGEVIIGAGATGTFGGGCSVVIGRGATVAAGASQSVIIGACSTSASQFGIAIGFRTHSANTQGIAIGLCTTATNPGFYVSPIRCHTSPCVGAAIPLGYCTTTKEIVFGLAAGGYGNADVTNLLSSGTVTTDIITTGNISATNLFGNLTLAAPGVTTDVLFNNNGIVGASSGLTFNPAINVLNVNGNILGGNISTAGTVNAAILRTTAATIALGQLAGACSAPCSGVAIGLEAGRFNQQLAAVAIGQFAGISQQGCSSVAVGRIAGAVNQGCSSVAIGFGAGGACQRCHAVAIGFDAAQTNQSINSIAIGSGAGGFSQGGCAVAIGLAAGQVNQGISAIAIGARAGLCHQANNSIILNSTGGCLNGRDSGFYVAPIRCHSSANIIAPVGLGYCTTSKEIVFGVACGGSIIRCGGSSVSIGSLCGPILMSVVGQQAGKITTNAVAIGHGAGINQSICSIAIGPNAGATCQSIGAIAIGGCAGKCLQGSKAIAIGFNSGLAIQGNNSIIIGACAGGSIGRNSINIGFKGSMVAGNSILLNASGTCLSKCNPGFFATSIRDQAQVSSIPCGTPTVMGYCFASNEITANVLLSTTGSVIGAFLHGDGSNITNLPAGNSISNTSTSIKTFCCAASGSILFTVGGNPAGGLVQNTGAISFGLCTVSGRNSIAIGKNAHACSSCAILLNATGSTITTCSPGFFVDPMRSVCVAGGTPQIMGYCNTTREIVFNVPTVSAFTIAAKPLIGTAGQMIAVTDSATTGGKATDGMIAFWDLSNTRWSYIIDNTAV